MRKLLFFILIGIFMSGTGNAELVCKAYSCNIGYYVSFYSCARCPSLARADGGTQYGTTASAGLSEISACYVPSGVTYKDDTGQFEFTSNCNYS